MATSRGPSSKKPWRARPTSFIRTDPFGKYPKSYLPGSARPIRQIGRLNLAANSCKREQVATCATHHGTQLKPKYSESHTHISTRTPSKPSKYRSVRRNVEFSMTIAAGCLLGDLQTNVLRRTYHVFFRRFERPCMSVHHLRDRPLHNARW